MSSTDCSNWYNSFVCSYQCCKESLGQNGCCSSDLISNFGIDQNTLAILGVVFSLLFLLILCTCLDSMTSPSKSAPRGFCSCGRVTNENDFGYTLVQRPIFISNSSPEIILIEKDFRSGEPLYTINDRVLNRYGNHYTNYQSTSTAPSAPPAYYN